MMVSWWNQFQWGQDKALRTRRRNSQLDSFGELMTGVDPQDREKLATITRLLEQSMAAMTNIPTLLAVSEAAA